MIETWSVERIMKEVTYSVDFGTLETAEDWRGMIAWKIRDRQVPALIDEILTNGFQVPVTLARRDYDDGYKLGNGHHRVVVAILLGLDCIPVETTSGSISSPHNPRTYPFHSNPNYGSSDAGWVGQ